MASSHYLNQCWNIVNWTLRNKLQWNLKRNSYIFIQENAFENGVCEMASICLGLNVLICTTNQIPPPPPTTTTTTTIHPLSHPTHTHTPPPPPPPPPPQKPPPKPPPPNRCKDWFTTQDVVDSWCLSSLTRHGITFHGVTKPHGPLVADVYHIKVSWIIFFLKIHNLWCR